MNHRANFATQDFRITVSLIREWEVDILLSPLYFLLLGADKFKQALNWNDARVMSCAGRGAVLFVWVYLQDATYWETFGGRAVMSLSLYMNYITFLWEWHWTFAPLTPACYKTGEGGNSGFFFNFWKAKQKFMVDMNASLHYKLQKYDYDFDLFIKK